MNSKHPISIAIGSGLSMYIILCLLKKSSNEPIDRDELIKTSILSGIVVFAAVHICDNKPKTPILQEPFSN